MDDLLFNIIKLLVIIVITAFMRYGIPLVKQIIESSKLSGAMKCRPSRHPVPELKRRLL